MLGCCGCGVAEDEDEQEAGGQQAQVGSLREGARGVLKSSKGRVIGFRSRWKALLSWLSGSCLGS